MSQALETMFNSLYNNTVPELWAAKVTYQQAGSNSRFSAC